MKKRNAKGKIRGKGQWKRSAANRRPFDFTTLWYLPFDKLPLMIDVPGWEPTDFDLTILMDTPFYRGKQITWWSEAPYALMIVMTDRPKPTIKLRWATLQEVMAEDAEYDDDDKLIEQNPEEYHDSVYECRELA